MFAAQAAIAIQNAQLYHQAQAEIGERRRAEEQVTLKNKQLTMLNQLGQTLNSLATLPEILERISDLIGQIFDNRNLYIALYDQAANLVSFPVYWTAGKRKDFREGRPLGNGLTEFVIRSGAPVLIPDHVRETLAESGFIVIGAMCQCYLGVPILVDGQVIGVIAVQDYEQAHVYNADQVELLSTIASQAAISIQNARLYETLQQELVERTRAEQQLAASEAELRALFAAMSDVVIVFDREGRYLKIAPTNPANFYNPPEEMLGKTVHEILPPEQADYIASKIGESLESGRVVNGEYPLQIAGRELWFSFNASPLSENTVTLVAHDITERKKSHQQLVYYNEKLEEMVTERTHELQDAQEKLVRQEKLALLGQVAGGVGHELRNPLTIIKNSAYFLRLVQPDANEKIKEHLGIIDAEIRTAEKIITELLDFSRIKSVDPEPFSVSALLQAMQDRFPAPAAVILALDLPPDLPRLYVDPEQMIRVLGNLALNAYQAMPAGGSLTISAHPQGEFVAIAVTDTGVGIPSENMPKLFEPLFTTKAKGIGLGLVVSRKLIEANHGWLEVHSQVGIGTTFSLFLPVKP